MQTFATNAILYQIENPPELFDMGLKDKKINQDMKIRSNISTKGIIKQAQKTENI